MACIGALPTQIRIPGAWAKLHPPIFSIMQRDGWGRNGHWATRDGEYPGHSGTTHYENPLPDKAGLPSWLAIVETKMGRIAHSDDSRLVMVINKKRPMVGRLAIEISLFQDKYWNC